VFARDADQAEAASPEAPDGQRASAPAMLALARLLGRLAALETRSNDDQGRDHD
jgi:hypothetical protein